MAVSERPRGSGRPTMNDVAHAAGVGLKTVSRVVNGEKGVLDGTAEKVREAIERLGYRRNDSARLLRRGQTASVGLVIEDVADPFYSELTRAVEEVTRQHGSLVFTGSSDESPDRERELVLAFCARRVDGLVVVPAGTSHRYLVPELTAGIAMVFVDRPPGDIDADTVLSANASGTRAGVHHLLRHGHRRIAFIGDSPGIFTAAKRLDGYRAALRDAGVAVDESLIVMGHPDPDFVRAALDKLLDRADAPTALFTSNSRATVAALRALGPPRSRPALVGFDDFELADLVTPAVTVVAQDPTGLGREAAELLFRRLEGDRSPVQHVELPTRLIPRGSGELPPGS
jgi:LacI family transcriptional regulator, galactose operon repressor